MNTIVIRPQNDNDSKFLLDLLTRLGYHPLVMDDEDLEDFVLLKAMLNKKDEDYVGEDEILKVLGRK